MTNSPARDTVLERIRRSLGVSQNNDVERKRTAQERLRSHKENLVPERAKTSGKSRLDLFVQMLEGQSATVSRARTAKDVPDTVAAYLREQNLPAKFRSGADPLIAEIPWDASPSLTRNNGPGQADDAVSLSRATGAAAETGTLFLTSGADNPTTLNFLPDTHIVVINEGDISGSYEEAWNALRTTYGEGVLPRTVNLVSGPSRTADIDQIIVMGAHGPRRLHVIVIG